MAAEQPGTDTDGTPARDAGGRTVEQLAGLPRLGPRYALALLPGRAGGGTLPERELALSELRVDAANLAAYARVCGFPLDGTLPVTYPQVLAFGPQIRLMTEPGFPVRLPGLVHLRQRIRQHRAIGADEPLELRVHAENLRAHPRGALVDLVAEVSTSDGPAWQARSSYLSRGGSAPDPTGADEPEPADLEAPLSARWQLAGDTGRRYASVSGDVNPIHLHSLTARLFGFRGAIAHGMWTAARCVSTLTGRLPDAYDVDVVFRKPVVLPTGVDLHTARTPTGWALTLRGGPDRDRVHLVMSVTGITTG
ncbi:MAG TPA: MaoC/PaaZ C-terminal domain-containing protein [Pseudonocardia sp.]|jgi:acyl dehydratase|nr:MaoC/PaaZ C-terminal domain-containing protein [Pseudonocardia sp.]